MGRVLWSLIVVACIRMKLSQVGPYQGLPGASDTAGTRKQVLAEYLLVINLEKRDELKATPSPLIE